MHRCNICGCTEFVDMSTRKSVKCKSCGSLERTRLLWFYLERLKIDKKTRILHLAPEKGLYRKLKELAGDNYVPADLDPARYHFVENCRKMDLCMMEDWPSNEFDLILHAHVFEHIPCNIAYPLFHLHRMLNEKGVHLCIVPFVSGRYDECFQEIDDDERSSRFGQYDHVRRFGKDDIQAHLGKILNIPSCFDARNVVSEEELIDANIPKSHWYGFHIGTVLSLKKNDYRLGCFE